MSSYTFHPIGVVHSEWKEPSGTPIQGAFAPEARGTVEVFPQFAEGLRDIEGFTHLWLLYVFHRAGPPRMVVTPFMDDMPHGVFATRAPSRPNSIGLSLVRLVRREGRVLHIAEVDILDGTPVLDIKPYVPRFDRREHVREGWLEAVNHRHARRNDDGRFSG